MIVNLFFAIDIVVGFTTSFMDLQTGEEIFSPKIICVHYMFEGDFVIDFLSTFPFLQVFVFFGA